MREMQKETEGFIIGQEVRWTPPHTSSRVSYPAAGKLHLHMMVLGADNTPTHKIVPVHGYGSVDPKAWHDQMAERDFAFLDTADRLLRGAVSRPRKAFSGTEGVTTGHVVMPRPSRTYQGRVELPQTVAYVVVRIAHPKWEFTNIMVRALRPGDPSQTVQYGQDWQRVGGAIYRSVAETIPLGSRVEVCPRYSGYFLVATPQKRAHVGNEKGVPAEHSVGVELR